MFCAYGSKPLGVVRGESAALRHRSTGSGQGTTLRRNTWQKQERDMQDKMAFAVFDGEHIHSVNAPYDEDTHCHYCEECHEEVVSDEAWAALDFGISLTTTRDFIFRHFAVDHGGADAVRAMERVYGSQGM